jgi:hypothetical protein
MLTKVLISVKTYPTLSTKYNELVCTAGFLEDGSWVRIYPLSLRLNQFCSVPNNSTTSKESKFKTLWLSGLTSEVLSSKSSSILLLKRWIESGTQKN